MARCKLVVFITRHGRDSHACLGFLRRPPHVQHRQPWSVLSSPSPSNVPLRHSKERPSSDDPPVMVSGDTARVPRKVLARARPRSPTDRCEPPRPTAPNGAVVARMSSTSSSPDAEVLRSPRLPLRRRVPPALLPEPFTPPRRCDAEGTERTGEPRRRRGLAPAPRSPWIAFMDAVYLRTQFTVQHRSQQSPACHTLAHPRDTRGTYDSSSGTPLYFIAAYTSGASSIGALAHASPKAWYVAVVGAHPASTIACDTPDVHEL